MKDTDTSTATGIAATQVGDRCQPWGVVLCGGQSSRMGQDKAALPYPGGGTYLQWAIARLLSVCGQVVVSGRRQPDGDDRSSLEFVRAGTMTESQRVIHVEDILPGAGPLGGLVSAMQAIARCVADPSRDPPSRDPMNVVPQLVVTPVDMPALTQQDLQDLWHRHVGQAPPILPTVATFDGQQLEPLVAVYPLDLFDELSQRLKSAQRSLWRWLQERPHRLCQLPMASAANVNTPQDRKRYHS